MTINLRIKKVLEDQRYTNSAFEKKNNLANGTIRKITIEENFNPSYKVINAFAVSFPELNLRWLITGEGEPYFGDVNASKDAFLELEQRLSDLTSKIDATANEVSNNKSLIAVIEASLKQSNVK